MPLPSTDSCRPLELSFRRSEMTGFWALATSAVSVSSWLIATRLGLPLPWAWTAGSATAVLLPGVFWPSWFETGIRTWNRGARVCAAAFRLWTLAVCYYVVLPVVGFRGSALELSPLRREATMWRLLAGAATETVVAPSSRWAQGWMAVFSPFVVLLSLLRDKPEDSTPPSSTYTLY